ncbi:hypothetical protein ACH4OT_35105 [Streptomyces murinus]|uniref:hypothetical protein n=1 Tax=Streptomyces murinus TaxID=33900 RepID=UPI0037BB2582
MADWLGVCHGDACAPDILVGDDGMGGGHVDLGVLGVADRTVATWNCRTEYASGSDVIQAA